jgi:hypothetical protein
LTDPTHIDPHLASKVCTPAEQEVVRMRNTGISWTNCAELAGRPRGQVRREWASANAKVNGGYVPVVADVDPKSLPAGYVAPKAQREKAGTKRAVRATDPDVIATWRGIPVSGAGQAAIKGTVPGQHLRSGK